MQPISTTGLYTSPIKICTFYNKSSRWIRRAYLMRKKGGWKWKSILHVPGAQPTHTEICVLLEKRK